MTDLDKQNSTPEDPGDGQGLVPRKGRQAFRKITRELSDEDLKNPAVQRILLDEIEKLEYEKDFLNQYRDQFHEADKHVEVLKEKIRTVRAIEILSGVCFTFGAGAIGYAPALWQSQPLGYIAFTFGVLLVLCGVIAQAQKR